MTTQLQEVFKKIGWNVLDDSSAQQHVSDARRLIADPGTRPSRLAIARKIVAAADADAEFGPLLDTARAITAGAKSDYDVLLDRARTMGATEPAPVQPSTASPLDTMTIAVQKLGMGRVQEIVNYCVANHKPVEASLQAELDFVAEHPQKRR